MLATQRHRRIWKLQVKIVAGIWGVLLSAAAITGGYQQYEHIQAQEEFEKAEQRSDFWRIIAGTQAPSSVSADAKLASTLSDLLGPIDPSATELPEEVVDYNVTINTFGGVERALGFEPFVVESGTGIGSLNNYMLNQLLRIKQGAVESVVADELSDAEPQGYEATLFGVPLVLWFGAAVIGGNTFALLLAVRNDSRDHKYDRRELNWKNTGGTTADAYKRRSKLVSPLYFWAIVPLQKGEDYEALLRNTNLLDEHRDLTVLLGKLHELPAGTQDGARDQIEQLLAQIDQQVRSYVGEDLTFESDDADRVSALVQARTAEIAQSLSLREEALRELNAAHEKRFTTWEDKQLES